jgi:arylsulfatase A-like enzyme
LYCSYEHGLDRGFAHYQDYEVSLGQLLQSSSLIRAIASSYSLRHLVNNYEILDRTKAPEVNSSFLHWLSSRQKGRPFFAFLNYYDAHAPYLPSEPFSTKFARAEPRPNPWLYPQSNWSPQDIQTELNAYEGAIAELDHQLGLLFDELQKRGVFDNTLVILTADHGEEFGEHGVMGHGSSLYLQSLHVPLLITFPSRVPEGKVVSNPVSIRDIPATVVDLLAIGGKTNFPGDTLARYWDGKRDSEVAEKKPLLFELEFAPNLPQRYPVSKGNLKALLVGQSYYIKNGDGLEELYDLANDPGQQRDLVRSGGATRDLDSFRVALEQFSHSTDQSQTKLLP